METSAACFSFFSGYGKIEETIFGSAEETTAHGTQVGAEAASLQHPHQAFVFTNKQEGSAMLRERLARNLKQLRRERNWTQEAAAERCDISPRYWGKLEQGKAAASLDTLDKIAAGLQLEPEVLLRNPDDTQL